MSVRSDIWKGTGVLAIKFLSSFDIVDVANNAGVVVTADFRNKAFCKTNFLQDAKVFPLLALVVGLNHMAALKKELKLFRLKFEVRGFGKHSFLFVLNH
jgi:hypothetical protein